MKTGLGASQRRRCALKSITVRLKLRRHSRPGLATTLHVKGSICGSESFAVTPEAAFTVKAVLIVV